ncbi:DNA polymerase I [Mobilicoccus pelagius]|uniref:DNA polymerase I n=1 Tax=Mobilicoccus pelagius NBRC 104925 TaxID=1089455 RepID=H5UTR7_9MICO|nr:DNA polymerase I [Mobilicoccus pelagius]GAB49125.1 DNA polymerase I [Mobilicoccus pelagius NBRC 104925]
MSRLLLLDGHSLAYRAFFALPAENFSTTTGQTTNAVYGFTSMLINVLRDEDPTHLAVAFDVSRQTFRTEQYAEYKATRSKTPDEFRGQVDLLKEVLDALRIRHVEVDGYEADDVIATLVTQANALGEDGTPAIDEVSIVTGDRDSFQLVTDTTTVLYPIKGVSELARMTPDAVEAKYGVRPERYPDLAAMVGESSDNLPGVPGVGPKTAAKWLGQYGDLTGIVANVTAIKGKAGESLREHLDGVLRNRRLNALVRDVALPVTLADLERTSWDREEVHRVFDSLEFRVLRDRLFETFAATPEESAGEALDVDGVVLEPADVPAWLDRHAAAGDPVGVCVVGTWAKGEGDAEGLALASGEGTEGGEGDTAEPAVAFVRLTELDPAGETAVGEWLADAARPKVFHDAKPQMRMLGERGWAVRGLTGDTALSAYLVRPDQRSYDLADLSVRYLHRELLAPEKEQAGQGTLDFSVGEDDGQARQAMSRARAVLDLWRVLSEKVEESGGTELLRDVELPLVDVLAGMERVGIAADLAALEELESHFATKVDQAQADAFEAIGHEVNLGSPKQLQVVLFEELDMPKTKKTKTGWTTDADALADLYAKTEHPFLEALLRHRDASRLRVTAEGLIKSVAPDGRIHTTYQQTIAATGRLSSTDPNLQNIPIRTDEGRRIRSVFVVGEGYETLMSADYSQIEMRIMAHLSGDEGLIEAYQSGEDLHRFVGSRVFGVPPAEVTPAMRSKVKAMSYGLAYGLSAFGLSKQLGISTAEARGLMDEYFLRFGGVRDYLRQVVDDARAVGYTETMFGRRRYLPDLDSGNRQRREMAERMALNAPIQGSAADIVKVAMLGVDAGLREAGLASRVLLQVHDELVLEVAPGELDTVTDLVRDRMGAAADLAVPLEVHIGTGRSWQDAEH